MKSVKILAVLLAVCLLAGSAYSAEHKIGHLSKVNMTSEEFTKFSDNDVSKGKTAIFTAGQPYPMTHVFYDSLMAMQMALNAGEVDAISLPEDVAEYLMRLNDGYKIVSIVRTLPSTLSFGFRKDDDPAMRNKFNEALMSMKADGTHAILREKYIAEPGLDEPEPVEFGVYENIDKKIKVAVTGDLPPIDFVAADGKPAGFNTAVLAEIARRLKVNVELVNIESGARAAALASGRVDAVFWFQFQKGADKQADVPEGVVLSESYYGWNEVLNIGKK